jgi:hypothetical protein
VIVVSGGGEPPCQRVAVSELACHLRPIGPVLGDAPGASADRDEPTVEYVRSKTHFPSAVHRPVRAPYRSATSLMT